MLVTTQNSWRPLHKMLCLHAQSDSSMLKRGPDASLHHNEEGDIRLDACGAGSAHMSAHKVEFLSAFRRRLVFC